MTGHIYHIGDVKHALHQVGDACLTCGGYDIVLFEYEFVCSSCGTVKPDNLVTDECFIGGNDGSYSNYSNYPTYQTGAELGCSTEMDGSAMAWRLRRLAYQNRDSGAKKAEQLESIITSLEQRDKTYPIPLAVKETACELFADVMMDKAKTDMKEELAAACLCRATWGTEQKLLREQVPVMYALDNNKFNTAFDEVGKFMKQSPKKVWNNLAMDLSPKAPSDIIVPMMYKTAKPMGIELSHKMVHNAELICKLVEKLSIYKSKTIQGRLLFTTAIVYYVFQREKLFKQMEMHDQQTAFLGAIEMVGQYMAGDKKQLTKNYNSIQEMIRKKKSR